MKKKIKIALYIFLGLIAFILLAGFIIIVYMDNKNNKNRCHKEYSYSRVIVSKTKMCKDSLRFDLGVIVKMPYGYADITEWENFFRVNTKEDTAIFSKLLKLKINDTITQEYCQILSGNCNGKYKVIPKKFPYQNDTTYIEIEQESNH